MFIERTAGHTIRKLMEFFPVVVCTGARQTGKTTLFKHLLPEYTYISLDLPSTAAMAEENPDSFFFTYPPPVIIDEVQYAPGLFRYLKKRIDDDRHAMGRYILTGSQNFSLMNDLSDSLAGRVGIISLESLSWQEARAVQAYSLDTYLVRGGFPELARQPDLPLDSWFSSYVATYLERDVRQLMNIGSLRSFEQFMGLLAVRNAQQLDMSGLATAIGVSSKTIAAWISVLEASNQITLLQPWHGNVGKRIVKTPKIYFNDTGLLCWFLGLTSLTLATSPFLGSLWETAVFLEIKKFVSPNGLTRRLFYYRDNQGLEIDFMVLGEGCRLIEAKSTQMSSLEDARNIIKFARLAEKTQNPELTGMTAAVACRTEHAFSLIKTENYAKQDEVKIPVQSISINDVPEYIGRQK